MPAATPVAADDPLMIAWNTYQQTDDYRNTFNWMGKELQSKEGTLWAAFMAGFRAASNTPKAGEGG